MGKIRFKLLILAGLAGLFLSQCQVAQRMAILNCRYSLLNVVPSRVGLTSMDLKLSIQIDNPNPMDVVLDRIGFDLFVNGSKVGSGDIRQQRTIPAGGTEIIEPIVKISYLRSGISIVKAIRNNEAYYEIRGRASYLVGRRLFTFPVKITSGNLY